MPQTVLRTSYVDDCLAWPGDAIRAPFTGPLPDVPALLLGGRLDTRTPLENARATAQELPHSTIVALKGSGHDALDSDITGCTAQALTRFIEDVSVGHPCLGREQRRRPDAAAAALAERLPLRARRRRQPRARAVRRARHGHRRAPGRAADALRRPAGARRRAARRELLGPGELRGPSAPAPLLLRARPACQRLAGVQQRLDLGHRARQRDRERHPEDQPRWHGDRNARRPSRALPPDATARRRPRCATAARCGRGRSRRGACRIAP